MLAADSLVTDLIFVAGEGPENDVLIDALGGESMLGQRQILDPDMQDPRFEMELSPSRPFRRRGERRLMLIDDSVAPMRSDPATTPVIPLDLRPAMDALVSSCSTLGEHIRLGRLFALGGWGEAVMVARSAIDMRAWSLQAWVIDPNLDLDGRRRQQPLTQQEFETKLDAYEKRLEELDEEDILSSLSEFSVERRDELLIVSLLEEDGTWDTGRALDLERALIAAERFSVIPGAPSASKSAREARAHAEEEEHEAKEPEATAAGPTLLVLERKQRPLFWIPTNRFSLGVAATLGGGDWESVLTSADADSALRDQIREQGADFVIELEFLSEVFVAGKPLSKPDFEAAATRLEGDSRSMEVHLPRFGPGLLIADADGKRFFTSRATDVAGVLELLVEKNGALR